MKWKIFDFFFLFPKRSMNVFLIFQNYMCIFDKWSAPWSEFTTISTPIVCRVILSSKSNDEMLVQNGQEDKWKFSECVFSVYSGGGNTEMETTTTFESRRKRIVWKSLYIIALNFFSLYLLFACMIIYASHEWDRFNELNYSITVKLLIIVLCVFSILLLLLFLLEFFIISAYYFSYFSFQLQTAICSNSSWIIWYLIQMKIIQ